jgi:ribonuclease HI
MKLVVHTDGGARGNPGPAAVGIVIERCQMPNSKCQVVHEFGKKIGEATNNVAEYSAVIEALIYINSQILPAQAGVNRKSLIDQEVLIDFFLDSTLVVNQLNGLFKVKEFHLRELLTKVRVLENEIGGQITYSYIPREQNRRADFFVNKALDELR